MSFLQDKWLDIQVNIFEFLHKQALDASLLCTNIAFYIAAGCSLKKYGEEAEQTLSNI